VVGDNAESLNHADTVLGEVLPQYPTSVMFMYYNARMMRGKNDLAGAIAELNRVDTSTLPAMKGECQTLALLHP